MDKNVSLLLFISLSLQQPPALGDLALQPGLYLQHRVVLDPVLGHTRLHLLQLRLQSGDNRLMAAELSRSLVVHHTDVLLPALNLQDRQEE